MKTQLPWRMFLACVLWVCINTGAPVSCGLHSLHPAAQQLSPPFTLCLGCQNRMLSVLSDSFKASSEGDSQASLSHTLLQVRHEVLKKHLNIWQKKKKSYSRVVYELFCSSVSAYRRDVLEWDTLLEFWWHGERVSALQISSNVLKTELAESNSYWHNKCESFCLKLLALTCSWLLGCLSECTAAIKPLLLTWDDAPGTGAGTAQHRKCYSHNICHSVGY